MSDSSHPSSRPSAGFFASTAPGLESIAAGELKALGIRGRQEIGGVTFGGELDRVYEANLWLRTASRIVVRLGRFHASTFYELERRAKKLPWEQFLPASGPVQLRVTCRKSRLYHSDAVAERIMSVIAGSAGRVIEGGAEAFNDERGDAEHADGAEHADENDAIGTGGGVGNRAQLFIVRIIHDEVEISADSSGDLLHRRGYRKEVAKAPLRETLAAAMVLASGWKKGEPLLDPMCGSGTIPIEAALIARGIAPGLERKFQFMNWPTFDEQGWNEIREKARGSVKDSLENIRGSDRDAGAIEAAARNAERAGVADTIRFSVDAVSSAIAALDDVAAGVGWILTNPPYGVRMGESEDLRNLYAKLGTALKTRSGWRVGILTSDAMLVRQTRLPLLPRFKSSNGGIPVSFLASEKPGKAEVRFEDRGKGVSVRTEESEGLGRNRTGVLASINISGGGVPKRRVGDAKVARLGLVNDSQNDKIHHGGPEQAVCVYSLERIHALQAEGHPIDVGTAGENVTVEGIDWELVVPGTRLRLGNEVLLEVSAFTTPCKTIRESFIDGEFVRISQKLHPGWSRVYTRVIAEGEIHSGDRVEATPPGE